MNPKNTVASLLAEKAMHLLKDPRVAQLLQSEQVSRAVGQAFQAQGAVRAKWNEQVQSIATKVAKRLNLATKHDLYRVSSQLERMQRALDAQKKKDSST